MNLQGYYRSPALFQQQIIFVSEDDLWTVPAQGGIARRLTTGAGLATTPVFSPDGSQLAFAMNDEGSLEVFVMSSQGGISRRLTYLGQSVSLIGWTEKGIIFSSSACSAFSRLNSLWIVQPEGGVPVRMPIGPANFITYGPIGTVIQRHGYREYGFWKRYRGGTAGELWIDSEGNNHYKKLLNLKSDLARPLWIKDRIYFASDHEGIGNLYSCTLQGQGLIQHTYHQDYYVRNQSTDGQRIIYHAGGDLFVFDPEQNISHKIDIDYFGPRAQRNRKFIKIKRYLEDYDLHPQGNHLSIATRGKIFNFANWEGAVLPLAEAHGTRFRLPRWLHDGLRLIVVNDQSGEDQLELYNAKSGKVLSTSKKLDLGRIENLFSSPCKDEIVLTNHRNEIILINIKNWKKSVIDRNQYGRLEGVAWSPDGEWIAYSSTVTRRTSAIKLYETATSTCTQITDPVLRDISPAFDPDGKYLYFLSLRQFDPMWDSLHFNLSFPQGIRPYLITLQKETPSPFKLKIPDLVELENKDHDHDEKETSKSKNEKAKKDIKKIKIDLEDIQKRLQAFPVSAGLYTEIIGLRGKVLFVSFPAEIISQDPENEIDENDHGLIETYEFETQKVESWEDRISELNISKDHHWLIYKTNQRLRIVKVEDKADDRDESDDYTRRSGWINLERVKVMVDPVSEWEHIFKEAWRLQRDHFWCKEISQIDWQEVFQRYFKLIPRVSTRGELSDILWEMQGELGTSHAYVIGGDVRPTPAWSQGLLGADFVFDTDHQAYRIISKVEGDLWQNFSTSPLNAPGLNLSVGDLIWEINGKVLNIKSPPEAYLLQQAGFDVNLVVSDSQGQNKRIVTVRPIATLQFGLYRDWVNKNRAYVHEKTNGKVGYVHIPDMSPQGFAEFHRGFLSECDRTGLIVDVRFNGGGSVSALILEKLARRRLGYDSSRWFDVIPYPEDSPVGPMVALTNQYAGSDGDIFSHSFKMMNLGPLIGKRTWGGVIGIWPRHSLIDGGSTTQPEFSFWFKDVGWAVENYGVDPDIEIDISPQDYIEKKDPQLDRSIEEVLKIMIDYPIVSPDIARLKK